ncbi:ATP-dependent DNA ligase [Paenibacillus polymyxa]|uniref:ATP-dependent DNA ligase n=1 Tax=Paenibacillus polymyxa TaxID=1406 RepID=UPI0020246F06|nr:ATP-dependent DNA ligase [Paenibacillus polymyxa]WDZ59484.1 ATP-dependent DNA ligase [Paenibacillus polymyxa]
MFISPMLLATSDTAFSDPQYIFEPKIDGHRLIFSQQNSTIRLYTRHNNDCTRQYPELLLPFGDDIVLDGEVACYDPATGLVDFESIMTRFMAKKSEKTQQLTRTLPVTFVIFDVLHYKGQDLQQLPLMQRKELLAGLTLPSDRFGIIPFIEGEGEALFRQMQGLGLEGMVGKKKDTKYYNRRHSAWQKVINWSYADVYITGYRKAQFGWLACVPNESGKMRPSGIIEFGATPTQKKAFYGVSKALITGEDREYVYVEPRIRARVKMRNWTKAGNLRIPVFMEFIV